LQRRLSRLEATLDRQIEFVRTELQDELTAVRQEAALLARENERLQARIGALTPEVPDTVRLDTELTVHSR
jgi:hypothetical protein